VGKNDRILYGRREFRSVNFRREFVRIVVNPPTSLSDTYLYSVFTIIPYLINCELLFLSKYKLSGGGGEIIGFECLPLRFVQNARYLFLPLILGIEISRRALRTAAKYNNNIRYTLLLYRKQIINYALPRIRNCPKQNVRFPPY